MTSEAYAKLMERVRDVGRLHAVAALLEWDQETYMPKEGVAARAEQIALVSGIAHERLVSEELRDLLEAAESAPDDVVAVTNVRETRRAYRRAASIPNELVKEIARTSSLARDAWVQARQKSDFAIFAPYLEKLLELKRRLAEHVGYETEPFDALMDEYEPGAKAAWVERLFADLRDTTVSLVERIRSSPRQPDSSILSRHYPKDRQERLARRMAEALHFDFAAGRADVSVHPFCTTIGGAGDVRITTRYHENFLPAALFGTLHETGHALYEQGLLREHAYTPMAEAASLGIHESQSRLWENLVGRSRAFWVYHYPVLQRLFPEALGDMSPGAFYTAINVVRPSLIRVEADELTYNLHIILRFEMERALLNGSLSVGDVPDTWNRKMTELLGVTPKQDAEGCLQDIHWSMGGFGYFPTYTLGNLYAAQFFEKAAADMPDLFDRIAANDLRPLLDWLREHIHRHGRRYRADELVEVVTGTPLSIEPFMNYATEKFSRIYDL